MLIDYKDLIKKHNLKVRGVIHLGASEGQEIDAYIEQGAENVIAIECIPEVFDKLKTNTIKHPNVYCFNECLSDKDGEKLVFNVSNNGGQSSSMFEFDQHLKEHPTVQFTSKIDVITKRFDSIVKQYNLKLTNYNYISLDLQGAELKALKGIGDILNEIEYIYCEVSERPMYKDQPLIGEIDTYLSLKGFDRVDYFATNNGWGDALYIRSRQIIEGIQHVPEKFRPLQPFPYPQGNFETFEEWFYKNTTKSDIPEGYTYLPIFWTSYYRKNLSKGELQDYLDLLDTTKKYFTIVQYDDGILNDISHLNIVVCAMSGNRIDVPLPLIAMPHPKPWSKTKTIEANFVGAITHPIRTELINMYSKTLNWYMASKRHTETEYRDIISQSTFTLCPRGYGQTSFRIMEALEHGSIPVYISDDFIVPFGYDFNEYGLLIHNSEISRLSSILKSISYASLRNLRENGKKAYERFYTYEGCKKELLKNLK